MQLHIVDSFRNAVHGVGSAQEGAGAAGRTAGVLQDIHWATGAFGYFPSYALGTAIAAQIEAHLRTVMPLDAYLSEGNFEPINNYLKDHPAPEDIEYYLCGPPMMISAVVNMLDNLGVPPENIMYDNFGS